MLMRFFLFNMMMSNTFLASAIRIMLLSIYHPWLNVSPEACLSSLFILCSNGFSSLFFTDINHSVISAAYHTSKKYFRGLFKTSPWRTGIY